MIPPGPKRCADRSALSTKKNPTYFLHSAEKVFVALIVSTHTTLTHSIFLSLSLSLSLNSFLLRWTDRQNFYAKNAPAIRWENCTKEMLGLSLHSAIKKFQHILYTEQKKLSVPLRKCSDWFYTPHSKQWNSPNYPIACISLLALPCIDWIALLALLYTSIGIWYLRILKPYCEKNAWNNSGEILRRTHFREWR